MRYVAVSATVLKAHDRSVLCEFHCRTNPQYLEGWTDTGIHSDPKTEIPIVLQRLKKIFERGNSKNLERAMGIEPTSAAWKADALPLCYARAPVPVHNVERALLLKSNGGQGWIRTNVA